MNSIMREIRTTSLNYAIKETPFSTNITLRKYLIHKIKWFHRLKKFWISWSIVKSWNKQMRLWNICLRMRWLSMKSRWKLLLTFRIRLHFLNASREVCKGEAEARAAGEVKAISKDKRSIQIKHEKMCVENKIFKNENEALMKEVNSLKVSNKAL